MSAVSARVPRISPRTWRLPVALALIALAAVSASAAPPSNDNFVARTIIPQAALPFSQTLDITEATTESNEPFNCTFSNQSVWYKFTPTADTWMQVNGSGVLSNIAIYRDNGLGINRLDLVGCTVITFNGTFFARLGDTYAFQATAFCCSQAGTITVNLQQIPPPVPVVNFFFSPSEPSAFDEVRFFDQSSDPGSQQIVSREWDFGDGTSSTPADSGNCCPSHQFPADGDYTVTLTVRTSDGRSGSLARTVTVHTHDVSITGFRTPQTAGASQTKTLTVSVANTRYPETVTVTLEKGVAGGFNGWQQIGFLTQTLPVRQKNRPFDFVFSYTFSNDDAHLGKVVFRASAGFNNYVDAFQADNQMVSSPVRISRTNTSVPFSEQWTDEAGTLDLAIKGVTPNPVSASGDLRVRLTLPRDGDASLQVLDVAGRAVAENDLGALAAGAHEVSVAWTRRPAPGVYWLRLSQAGQTAKIVRVAVLD